MIEARAITLNVLRLGQHLEPQGAWWCRPESTPAVPVRVVADRRAHGLHEFVLQPAMTPGATYVLGSGDKESRGVAVCLAPMPAAHRFDLWLQFPQYNRSSDATGDLRALTGCLQDVADIAVACIDRMSWELDVERASPASVARILEDLGNPFRFSLSPNDARKLASLLVPIYAQKGTARGIQNAIRLFLGLEARIDCHIVTKDEEGIRTGGSDPNSVYSFSVAFGHPLTSSQDQRVRSLVEYLKPAHTVLRDVLSQSAKTSLPPTGPPIRVEGC